MHNIALTWQQAARLAVVLFTIALLGRWLTARTDWSSTDPARRRSMFAAVRRGVMFSTPFITEIAFIAALYAIWQFLGTAPVFDASGAVARGEWIERFEHSVHLPSEHVAQAPLLDHPLLAQTANLYYATMHFTALFVVLLWVFVRHRDRYRQVRTLLVLLTVSCFVVQLLPVAPPRLLPDAGYADTAAQYGQSVYTAFGAVGPDQLSAMPSLHVGWSVLVAVTAILVSTSRWRWFVLLHPLLTIYFVSATANHYWADGIIACVLLAASMVVLVGTGRHRSARRATRHSPSEPVFV